MTQMLASKDDMYNPFDEPQSPMRQGGDSALPPVLSEQIAALNPPQQEAVNTTEGALLVLAGAGTGKTRVLTTRIASILASRKAWPSQILSVTFTNKAAAEMRERIATLVGGTSEGLWLGTFHSIGVRILRRNAELLGMESSFTILDTDDQLRLIKQLIKAHDIDDKKFAPRIIAAIISRWKDRALTPEKVSQTDLNLSQSGIEKIAHQIYTEYQERLRILNAVDFGDLLLLCLKLFETHPDVLQHYRDQFKYILVDEYQDTNVAQYLWLRLLAQQNGNICCVGDDDQSIYGWRGAEVGNILRFEKDFAGAKVIRLEQNYRSTAHILGAASALIAKNAGRFGKELWTEQEGGEKVVVRSFWDGAEEARMIGEEIEHLQRQKQSLSTMAILVRAGFQTREFEERFITMGIPYRVIGGPRFYERLEIRDALAYLRLVVQPSDSLAFERIVNTPRRGIGNATLQVLHQYARSEQISLTESAYRLMDTDEIRGKARGSLESLLKHVARWRDELKHMPHGEVARLVLDESGYTAMWQADKSPEAPGRLENLKELVRAIDEFETLQGFLEHVSLVMDNNSDQTSDMVSVMTLHSAKGLEFDTVFLAGWEEGLFPHPRAMEESGSEGLEEERRLAYVGITRAKKQAIITHAANRRIHNQWQSSLPSRFIEELPRDHIEIIGQKGLYGGFQPSQRSNRSHYHVESGVYDVPDRPSKGEFQRGERVFHMKFGYGIVCSHEGDKLNIKFDHSGMKKVMKNFLDKA